MKRFYKQVSYIGDNNKWRVLLDGKPMKTPLKNDLIIDNEIIAQSVQEEWQQIEDIIDPEKMPITQICITAQDYVSENRSDIQTLILRYLDSDLLCYHTDHPPELNLHQKNHWSPQLKWFKESYNIELPVKNDLSIHRPSQQDYDVVKHKITAMDLYEFTLFQLLVSISGSIVLAFAFMDRQINAEHLSNLTKLEELFYIDHHDLAQHGQDPIQEKEFNNLKESLNAYEAFINSLASEQER